MKKVIAVLLVIIVILGAFGLGYSMNRSTLPKDEGTVSAPANVSSTVGEATVTEQITDVKQEFTAEVKTTVTENGTEITLSDAKQIALNDAGVAEADAARLHGRLDYDDGRKIYDVEFYSGNIEYDYEILADSGEIFERNHETHGMPPLDATVEVISEDEAKENALDHAGVSLEDAKFIRVTLEKDDGREEYEIEFTAGGREYDYVIDPYTGEILEVEME